MTSRKEQKAAQAFTAVSIREQIKADCHEQGLGMVFSNAEDDGSHMVRVNDLTIKVLENGEVQLNGETQPDVDVAVKAAKQQIASFRKPAPPL